MKTRRIVDRYVLTEEPLRCGHCGAKTPMYIVCTGDNVEVYDGSRDKGLFAEYTWQVLLCPSCHLENVFQFVQFADDACLLGVIDDEEIWETPVTTDMLYPHRNLDLPDPHPDMPSRIKEDYEEAQNVLSEEFVKSNANPFVRVAKEGRKFGLGLVAITQRPSAISEEIRTQAENFFAFHMGNSDDIKALVKSNINFEGVISNFVQRETIPGNLYMVSSDQAFALPVRVNEFEKLVGDKVYKESKFTK